VVAVSLKKKIKRKMKIEKSTRRSGVIPCAGHFRAQRILRLDHEQHGKDRFNSGLMKLERQSEEQGKKIDGIDSCEVGLPKFCAISETRGNFCIGAGEDETG
jgi:hypothetical protein